MASIRCFGPNRKLREHIHGSIAEVKVCQFTVPAPTPIEPLATPKQIAFLQRKGWSTPPGLTKARASSTIDSIIKAERNAPAPAPVPDPTPVPVALVSPPEPKKSAVSDDPRLSMIDGLISMVPEGYYATDKDGDGTHIDYLYIGEEKHGKRFKGHLVVKTQHSDEWVARMVKWKETGKWSVYPMAYGRDVIEIVLMVLGDYKTCARRYAIETQRCMRCGKKLTDDRSRHYLVGPECESKHGFTWPIAFADEQNGMTFEQLVARGMDTRKHHEDLKVA
jgi:hypothetical protein